MESSIGLVETFMDQIDLEQFHDDLKAAVIADIPLVVGQDHRLSVTELEKLQRQLEAVIQDPQRSVDKANREWWHVETLPAWYQAALSVFARTGSMLPVLEGLSVRPLAIRDIIRALRWTFIYLLIVATTALLGMCMFEVWVVPAIEYFREDLFLPAAIEAMPRFDVLPWLPWIIGVLALGVVSGVLAMLVGSIANLTTWLGGRRYVCCAISMTVLRISQSLVEADVAVDDAVSIGCELTGADSTVRREVQSMIQGCDQPYAIGQMADCLRLTANSRLARMKIVTPVLLTAILGGGLAVIYCLIVFWPIVSLLKDLPRAGV